MYLTACYLLTRYKIPRVHLCADSLPNVTHEMTEWLRHFPTPSLDAWADATYSETAGNNFDDNGYSGCIRCFGIMDDGVVLAGRKAMSPLSAPQESSQRHSRL